MKIVFSNNTAVDLILESTPLATVYQKIYKHLGHVAVPFRDWDHPFYCNTLTELVEQLVTCGKIVSVEVDAVQCFSQNQEYFNFLHQIYEKKYNGDPAWLNFHEHIHMCERWPVQQPTLTIDYREKAGMLEQPFDLAWLENATTKIQAGDVYVEWSELGKTPYSYWKDHEPNNLTRMCELAKPWVTLIPKLQVALTDTDTLANKKITEFENWWKSYSNSWCQHWQIPKWTIADQYSVIVIGRIDPIEPMMDLLKNQIHPIKVQL